MALAATCIPSQITLNTHTQTDLGCFPNDPILFVTEFYGIGLGVIGLVGMLFLIIGGYNLVLSRGDPNRVNVGKSYIVYAIIGILLAVFGFIFMQVVAADILKIPGF